MKYAGKWMIFFLALNVYLTLAGDTPKPQPEDELAPVQMTFVNNSRFPIYIHLFEQETLIKAHFLKPGKKYELKVEHGDTIQLEYPPQPYKTVLKPADSINEISRTITFVNDGEHVKINEKFKYQKNAKIEDKKKKKKKEENPE
jgi:hypothetical protein